MRKTFIHYKQSWWHQEGQTLSNGAIDEISLASNLGTQPERPDDLRGELTIRWCDINGTPTARLEIYEDAWHYLTAWPNLFKHLASITNTNPTPEELIPQLEQLGFINITPHQNPYAPD